MTSEIHVFCNGLLFFVPGSHIVCISEPMANEGDLIDKEHVLMYSYLSQFATLYDISWHAPYSYIRDVTA